MHGKKVATSECCALGAAGRRARCNGSGVPSLSVPSHKVFIFNSRSKRLNLFLDIPTHKPPGMPSERLYVALKSF